MKYGYLSLLVDLTKQEVYVFIMCDEFQVMRSCGKNQAFF